MSEQFEMEEPERLAVAAIGEPGQRVFLLQASQGKRTLTLKIEKTQVAALVVTLVQILQSFPEAGRELEAPDVEGDDLPQEEPGREVPQGALPAARLVDGSDLLLAVADADEEGQVGAADHASFDFYLTLGEQPERLVHVSGGCEPFVRGHTWPRWSRG